MWTEANGILKQAAVRIATRFANALPGLIALALAVVVAIALAWTARAMIRRSLRGIGFDKRMERSGLAGLSEWLPVQSPTQLIAGLAYWCIILVGLLVGLSALDPDVTSLLIVRLFAYVPNAFAAVLIVVAGVFIARFLARGVLISAVNMQVQAARLLSLGVKWLVMVVSGAMAMQHLGIGGQIVSLSFGILFGGIVLALALAVGLGSKEIVSRSLERQAGKSDEEEPEEHFHHL
jgi:mechanosensitive ion channel-like protein